MQIALTPTDKVLPGHSVVHLECRHPVTGRSLFRRSFKRDGGEPAEAEIPDDCAASLIQHLERSGYIVGYDPAELKKATKGKAGKKKAEQGEATAANDQEQKE